MKKLLLFFIFSLLNSASLLSNEFTDFLPLNIGNKWFYNCTTWQHYNGIAYDRAKVEVTDTLVVNHIKYYTCQRSLYRISGSNAFVPGLFLFANPVVHLRVDSSSGEVVYYTGSGGCTGNTGEYLFDDLSTNLLDTEYVNCSVPQFWSAPYKMKLIASNISTRAFTYQWGSQISRTYQKDIGLVLSRYYTEITGFYQYEQSLIGRVIDGIVFGDTAFVFTGINRIAFEIPVNFLLHQNYPNPFNPLTKIKFDISGASSSQTLLTVYDLLGREVAVLVNEKLTPGEYEVDFDGSNLPSGVYYYALSAGDFSETRKMVLIK